MSLAVVIALTSCGKSREEELKSITSAHKSLLSIAEVATPFLSPAENATGAEVKQIIMENPEKWELVKDVIPDIDGLNKENLKNFKEWFSASLTQSGKLIKESKPSNADLKEAHEKLSEMHTKFEVVISWVSAPEGTVSAHNEKLSKFNQELMEYLAWWKREMAN
jgi:hypothetical protein